MVTVAETGEFIRKAKKLLGEDGLQALISFLSGHPTSGTVMEGTGGIRNFVGHVRVWGKAVACG